MKIHHVLVIATGICLAPLTAAEPIGINALAAEAASHNGKEITVTGHIDRVSAARRMVVLIDATEATCTDGCDRKTLVVELPEGTEIPAKGKTLTATGKLSADSASLRLVEARAVTSE